MSDPINVPSSTFQFTIDDVRRIRAQLAAAKGDVEEVKDNNSCLIDQVANDPDFETRFPVS